MVAVAVVVVAVAVAVVVLAVVEVLLILPSLSHSLSRGVMTLHNHGMAVAQPHHTRYCLMVGPQTVPLTVPRTLPLIRVVVVVGLVWVEGGLVCSNRGRCR